MDNLLSRKFLIYSYSGDKDFSREVRNLGMIAYYEGEAKALEMTFYGADNGDLFLYCEVKANPSLVGEWTDAIISSQTETGLHYGIYLTCDILPKSENKDYIFYRHGNDICKWLKGIRELK